MPGFFSSFTCEAEASTPAKARINDAKMTSVLTFVKSGTMPPASKCSCETPPVARYATRPIRRTTAGISTPPKKPILAMRAVSLVPPSYVSVSTHTIIATPMNMTSGLL